MPVMIGGREIGRQHPPFVVAEMSGNHNGSLERALEIVDAAALAGACAIKLQTFDADSMTLRSSANSFRVPTSHALWGGRNLWDLYRKAETPKSWHRIIFERASSNGILCFSTPFDERAVDFLEELDPPAYKIASFECTDLPLIRYVASTRRPLIISTGMATMDEVKRAVDAALESGCEQLVLMKCTSTYPANEDDSNVNSVPILRDHFKCEVGLSDHTFGLGASVAAVALGASVIEKHFTLDRTFGGVDSDFSLEPAGFCSLVEEVRRGWRALGMAHIGPTEAELDSLRYRRSIFVTEDIRAGEPFTEENVRRLRPADGLEPRHFGVVLGRVAVSDITAGTPLNWGLVGGLLEG